MAGEFFTATRICSGFTVLFVNAIGSALSSAESIWKLIKIDREAALVAFLMCFVSLVADRLSHVVK